SGDGDAERQFGRSDSFPERPNCRLSLGADCAVVPAAVDDEAIDEEQHDRTDDRRDPRGEVEELVERMSVEQRGGDEAAQQGADDYDDFADTVHVKCIHTKY